MSRRVFRIAGLRGDATAGESHIEGLRIGSPGVAPDILSPGPQNCRPRASGILAPTTENVNQLRAGLL